MSNYLPQRNLGNGEIPPPKDGLGTFYLEVSWGGIWVNLNDGVNFKVGAESFAGSQVNWRKVQATSPVVEGSFLVHAVKDLTSESIQVYCYGVNQNALAENVLLIEKLFSQLDYRIRITLDDYREYWRCQPADYTLQRSQVMTHNQMAFYELTVPRFPTVTRELIA